MDQHPTFYPLYFQCYEMSPRISKWSILPVVLSLGHLRSSQPVFSCYVSELTFTKDLQCTSTVSRMAAVSTSPQSAISSLTLFTFHKGFGFHFQQYYFSFPCYTFSFCKISHRFITGSQGSNTITYSAVCTQG